MKRVLLFILIFLCAEITLFILFSSVREQKTQEYYDTRIALHDDYFKSSVDSYEKVFTNLFRNKLDTEEVKRLIYMAVKDPENIDIYRYRLLEYTKPYYESLNSIGLENVNFHMPGAINFLRMERPLYYGDDLSFRRLLLQAENSGEFVKGFENGRYQLAYRFIFPLYYDNLFIGTVEMSVGIQSFISKMNRIFGIGYSYLLEKNKIFRNYSANYIGDFADISISNEYILDTCDSCVRDTAAKCSPSSIRAALTDSIINDDSRRLKRYKGFAEIINLGDDILYTYIPVSNNYSEWFGYIVSHEPDDGYAGINRTYRIIFAMVSISMFSIFAIVFALYHNQRKIKAINSELETKVKEKVAELNEKNQFISQQSKMVTMGEMLNSILHQWKQPLNAISMISDIMIFDYSHKDCEKESLENLKNIKEQAIFMSQTGNDFRNFMKPSKEKVRFKIAESIEEVINLFRFSFDRYGVDFDSEWDYETKENALVLGYPNEFKHIMLNFFNNSRDAIVELRELMVGREEDVSDYKGVITVSVEIIESEIIVKVSDTGGGMVPDVINRVFEKDFSTKESQGSGIGLFIAKEMVEKSMSGSVSVMNIPGGAEFTLIFPLSV